jgi:hypothetical protein
VTFGHRWRGVAWWWRRAYYMNIRAKSTFRAGSFAAVEARVVPKIIKAVTGGTQAVYELSQEYVAVDTGELKDSGGTEVTWIGQVVKGQVYYTAGHAGYVEFGTGLRGAGSLGAGPFAYDPEWPGMVAQPYLRPALDVGRARIIASFADQGFKV